MISYVIHKNDSHTVTLEAILAEFRQQVENLVSKSKFKDDQGTAGAYECEASRIALHLALAIHILKPGELSRDTIKRLVQAFLAARELKDSPEQLLVNIDDRFHDLRTWIELRLFQGTGEGLGTKLACFLILVLNFERELAREVLDDAYEEYGIDELNYLSKVCRFVCDDLRENVPQEYFRSFKEIAILLEQFSRFCTLLPKHEAVGKGLEETGPGIRQKIAQLAGFDFSTRQAEVEKTSWQEAPANVTQSFRYFELETDRAGFSSHYELVDSTIKEVLETSSPMGEFVNPNSQPVDSINLSRATTFVDAQGNPREFPGWMDEEEKGAFWLTARFPDLNVIYRDQTNDGDWIRSVFFSSRDCNAANIERMNLESTMSDLRRIYVDPDPGLADVSAGV